MRLGPRRFIIVGVTLFCSWLHAVARASLHLYLSRDCHATTWPFGAVMAHFGLVFVHTNVYALSSDSRGDETSS